MPPLRKKRKSRTTAPAVVLFTQRRNPEGKKQLCVMAQCTYGGTISGPIWGHSTASVSKCLAIMSSKCDCGRKYHKHRFTEGVPIRNKSTPA